MNITASTVGLFVVKLLVLVAIFINLAVFVCHRQGGGHEASKTAGNRDVTLIIEYVLVLSSLKDHS